MHDGGGAGGEHRISAHRPRRAGAVLRLPINHFEGNYTCPPEVLAQLQADDRIVLRYLDNPNGSVDDIAGICSAGRNVCGLMPHPERACDILLGSADGRPLLAGILQEAWCWRTSRARRPRGYSAPRLMPALRSTPGSTPACRQAA